MGRKAAIVGVADTPLKDGVLVEDGTVLQVQARVAVQHQFVVHHLVSSVRVHLVLAQAQLGHALGSAAVTARRR